MQKTTAKTAMRSTKTQPMLMPIIAPTEIPLSDSDDWPSEDGCECGPDPEWLRLVWDLPGGGGVYGGGGGAGPLSKEFPSYLF